MKEKLDRDPKMLVEKFKNIVDENGFVRFDDYGAPKEPAARRFQAEQLFNLSEEIANNPAISIGIIRKNIWLSTDGNNHAVF